MQPADADVRVEDLAAHICDQLGPDLTNFLVVVLHGLERIEEEPVVRDREPVRSWITMHKGERDHKSTKGRKTSAYNQHSGSKAKDSGGNAPVEHLLLLLRPDALIFEQEIQEWGLEMGRDGCVSDRS